MPLEGFERDEQGSGGVGDVDDVQAVFDSSGKVLLLASVIRP